MRCESFVDLNPTIPNFSERRHCEPAVTGVGGAVEVNQIDQFEDIEPVLTILNSRNERLFSATKSARGANIL